jgi:acid phosphatase family membrane protein YuiD
LWHTPIEVLWWVLIGLVATFILYYYFITTLL